MPVYFSLMSLQPQILRLSLQWIELLNNDEDDDVISIDDVAEVLNKHLENEDLLSPSPRSPHSSNATLARTN